MASDDSTNGPSLLLFDLLPSLLLRKIPTRLRSHSASAPSTTCPSRPLSQASMDSVTPPPSYQSNVEEMDLSDEQLPAFRSFPMSAAPSRHSSSGSTTPTNTRSESKSGIQWKYANTGFALLSLAAQEDANATASSTRLTRREYIDGVACMLRGLPAELTEDEELSIQEAIPAAMGTAAIEEQRIAIQQGSGARARQSTTPQRRQSTLHRCVAEITLYVFLTVSFVLPYLQLLLRQAYQFDRKHKISDRVLAQSVIAADMMGKRTITMASSICAMNDGKVGDSMKEIGLYLVQGFSAGVYDGVGEGMQKMGLRGTDATMSRNAASLDMRYTRNM
ncbi:hypothetical protein M409DRAFT_64418 [Zasmidium cellare ATCC 36951]|uniref:Uncharacterized protein n=1 Tax=Zasmidium cellare ATCC 36951 TaxID=1080233 RepID=A0A6A6CRY5_ZASCE|nr:uncharacterized protein M409DRAFT_64418 [Zasmidium cellare ATCC 36951]KAF2170037.1 hypothetical protein M409DRAFT_64418 [Zasmidium cellare ATCC 36951]